VAVKELPRDRRWLRPASVILNEVKVPRKLYVGRSAAAVDSSLR